MKKILFILSFLMLAFGGLRAQEAAGQLARRILGSKADHFEFDTYRSVAEKASFGTKGYEDLAYLHSMPIPMSDCFTISMHKDKIAIWGTNDNCIAVGLNYYLRNIAHVHVSWYAADPVELPSKLPPVKESVFHQSLSPVRFFLNYCTYGYTMVWWKWEQWERFIDWMALNGVNMPLALTGQEAVWQEVWREMGMTDDEIRAYFSGPAHLPWHRMANLDGFGGPLPQRWIDEQKDLQKRILARERELDMTPVLPAFAGHVPKRVAELNPQADIQQLSSWCGFEPTYFLNSTDSLFADIQRRYLEKQTGLYGTDHIYGVDPFNEMDPPSWDTAYLAGVSENIYASLHQVDTAARWLQMSWVFYYKRKQWTPERLKAYLSAVPQGRMVLLDYFCEHTEVWRQTEAFYGQPFIWCYLGNFGGNTMLVGDLNALDSRLSSALKEQPGNMIGIGSTLESFDNSPQTCEFLLEQPWQQPSATGRVHDFARRWADCRYGKADNGCREAWRLLLDSVYCDNSFYGLGCQMTARPSLAGHGTYYTKPYYSYSNDLLLRSIRLLLNHPSKRKSYQYDVANLTAQWAGNYFAEIRDAFADAHRNGDVEAMEYYRNIALDLMDQTDWLLMQVYPNFLDWTEEARSWGRRPLEKDYYETQARTLLSIWGGPVLNDYANRMWGGLLGVYYSRRWEQFFEAVIASHTEHTQFDPVSFDSCLSVYEHRWAADSWWTTALYSSFQPSQQARKLLRAYDHGRFAVPSRTAGQLQQYMTRYPEAQLRDVYKFLFQDVYGPGHIIKNAADCAQHILSEMEQMQPSDTLFPDYEYAGLEGNFVRVNLRVIKDGRVPLDQFVDLLMQSAKVDSPMPLYDWKGRWQMLLAQLRRTSPCPHDFDADAAEIKSLLDSGRYAAHHSSRFNTAYHPHYRLIRRDLFEDCIKPKL